MDKQLFDDAIGEVPPSTVDVDAAIARGRRAAWTRVANPMVAVAAGVVLVAGGAVALTLPDDGAAPVTAAQAQPTTRTEPTAPGRICEARLDDPEGQRLTEVLAGVLAARGLLIGAELTGDRPLEFVPLYTAPDAMDSCMAFRASAEVNGTGRLTVLAGVAGPEGTAREPACAPGTYTCYATYGPADELVINDDDPENGLRVDVVRPDGTVIAVLAEGTPPLTMEQLREIGLDPALTLRR